MKWISMIKYDPPSCTDMFIRAYNGEYCRYFVGMIENLNNKFELEEWEFSNGETYQFFPLKMYKVTHFALIEETEVESY
jgi:hypothetical protein